MRITILCAVVLCIWMFTQDTIEATNIGVLYTGGTIGCAGEPLTPLSEDDFETAFNAIMIPIIKAQYPDCTISFISFGTALDSTNLQPSDWCKMAKDLLPNYPSCDAFIILHGTDTMAWTASALSFLFTGLQNNGFPNAVLTKPIIVTGSQLPLFYQKDKQPISSILFNTDAVQNVCGAVAVAYSGVPEVCLYFNNTLFRGNRTVKTDASEFDAFSSPNYPSLGEYGVEFNLRNEHILHLPTTSAISLDSDSTRTSLTNQLTYISNNINNTIVIPFPAFPAYYAVQGPSVISNMLTALISQVKGINGLILESYGEGNFPSGDPDQPEKGAIYQALKAAHDNGVVLIDCTQVLRGTVNAGAYASGSWLTEVGAVGAYDMTPIAALTKLIYLQTLRNYNGNNWGQATIEQLMLTNLTGEIMDINRLDARGKCYLAPGESIMALDGSAILVNDFNLGPILNDASGKTLWAALSNPGQANMPGRLTMQDDGNLVFYDRSDTVRYASNTCQDSPKASMLILESSTKTGIRLYIYNYGQGKITATLYPGGGKN